VTGLMKRLFGQKKFGIVKGYKLSDGSFVFRPNNNITRQEMAVMIYNFINLKDLDIEDKNSSERL
jgi:hypothetical protein